jgi:hypothetical protein
MARHSGACENTYEDAAVRRAVKVDTNTIGSAVLLCFVLFTTSGDAQIDPQALTLAGVSDCIKEAIASNSVEDDHSVIIFSCGAGKARVLYNFLGRKVRATGVQDRNGKFENRPFGNNACYHQVEDEGGRAMDAFRCDLIISVGNVLSE